MSVKCWNDLSGIGKRQTIVEQVSISKEFGVRVEDVVVEEEDKGPLRCWLEELITRAVGSFGITFTNLKTEKCEFYNPCICTY